jgi:hypothetical protein
VAGRQRRRLRCRGDADGNRGVSLAGGGTSARSWVDGPHVVGEDVARRSQGLGVMIFHVGEVIRP